MCLRREDFNFVRTLGKGEVALHMVSKWKALTCCSPLCTSFRRGGQLLPTLLFNNFWKFQAHSFNFSAREREDAQEWIIRSQKVFDFSIFQFTFQLPFLLAPDFYQLQLIEDCVWPASKTIWVMQQIQLFSHFFFTKFQKTRFTAISDVKGAFQVLNSRWYF